MKADGSQIITSATVQVSLIALSLVLALVLVEIVVRLFWPVADPHQHWRQANDFLRSQHSANVRREFVFETALTGLSDTSTFTTNNLGFRGDDIQRPKPSGEYRVFLVGGSTMECLILDDSDSIDAVLERALRTKTQRRVEVYNAGKSGDRSDDHVAMISQRIMHLEPDLVVLFAGINDLVVAAAGHDYLHLGSRDFNEWSLVLTNSHVVRLAWYWLKGRPMTLDLDTRILGNPIESAVLKQQLASNTLGLPPTNPGAFRNNLRSIIGIVKGHPTELVLMTQQTTWNSQLDPSATTSHWMRDVQGAVYSETNMHAALESLNDVMRDLAREHEVPLYDLTRDMPKSSEYFYDDVHFNIRGAQDAAIGLARVIEAQDWLDDS